MSVDQLANEKVLTQSRSSFQHVLSNYPIVFLLFGVQAIGVLQVSYKFDSPPQSVVGGESTSGFVCRFRGGS